MRFEAVPKRGRIRAFSPVTNVATLDAKQHRNEMPMMSENTRPLKFPGRRGFALVGVLTVIDEEFAEVSPVLGTTENIVGSPYYVRPNQALDALDVVLCQLGGRGNVKAGSAANRLMEDFRPPYLVLVGIAGGVKGRDGTDIADVIVPNFIDYYEIRKLENGKSLRRMEPHDHPGSLLLNGFAIPVSREEWISAIDHKRRPEPDGKSPKVRTGYLISGEKVLSDDTSAIQRQLLSEFDKAIAVDMESFGIAEAVFSNRITRHYNPQFLIVRGISDLVRALKEGEKPEEEALGDKSNNEVRQQWKPYAAHAAAVFAKAVIDRLLRSESENSGTAACVSGEHK